ncbi:hypothetical protein [Nostoc sp.]|uniref:hypothetical protein n=1 Tax=Nostoc sp. TaxID=1180 RepID=UPI002FF92721
MTIISTSEAKNSGSYPPGPKGHFLLGSLFEYNSDSLNFLSKCAQEYGDVVFCKGSLF